MRAYISLLVSMGVLVALCSCARRVKIDREFLGKRLADLDDQEDTADTRSHLRRVLGRGKPKMAVVKNVVATLSKLLNLEKDEKLEELHNFRTKKGVTKTRYQEKFMGIPVYGAAITAANTDLTDVTGNIMQDLNADVKSVRPRKTSSQALTIAKTAERDTGSDVYIEVNKNQLTIYTDKTGKARLAYEIDYFRSSETRGPSHPYYIIDANTGAVIRSWQGLAEAYQNYNYKGGNEFVGKLARTVQISSDGKKCTFKNAHVEKILDMKGKEMDRDTANGKAVVFDCKKGPGDAKNGAYNPMLDALLFATKTMEMYKTWFPDIDQYLPSYLTVRVHNKGGLKSYWSNRGANFGDGDGSVHPPIVLDTVAHEISHGFTSKYSQLEYDNKVQSGGINEAFSDIAGEAAEFFVKGSCDWKVGAEVIKKKSIFGKYFGRDALRYFDRPSKDNESIDKYDAKTYPKDGMNVHHSSGVFRRAFYELVEEQKMDLRKAFEMFVFANMNYWRKQTDFKDGLCGLRMAAQDRFTDAAEVQGKLTSAFEEVGVNACEEIGKARMLRYKQAETIKQLDKGKDMMFEFYVPGDCVSLGIRLTGGTGKLTVYEKRHAQPNATVYDNKESGSGSVELFRPSNELLRVSAVYYYMLKADDTLHNYSITAIFSKQTYTPQP